MMTNIQGFCHHLGHNRVVKRMSVHEAKAHFSSVLKEVEAGEIVIITRHDKPVIELRAASKLETPQLGAFADPKSRHLEVSWTEDELREVFGDLVE